jgi:hypothetical protein
MTLTLSALPKKVVKSSLLAGGPVTVQQAADALRVIVAENDRQQVDTVVKLELDAPATDVAPIETPREPKPTVKKH